MSSAINHRKRSHRSQARHYQAARQMKGSAPRHLGLRMSGMGLDLMAAIRSKFRPRQRAHKDQAEK